MTETMTIEMPEPDIMIRLTSSYYFERLERMLRDLQPLLTLSEPAVFRLDLLGLAGLGPAALALLSAALERLAGENLILSGSTIIWPKNAAVQRYIQRMDVLKSLGLVGDFERRDPDGFRPCQQFVGDDGARVARSLTDAVKEKCDLDDVADMSMYFCLSELADNVFYHADTGLGGFAVAQHWRTKKMFEIAIADLGVGILSSLRKNPDYADVNDDLTAIEAAIRPRVTSTPERNSGIGLFVTERLLAANGGQLLVRSGYGAMLRGAAEADMIRADHMPGTLVAIRICTDRPLNIREVYRKFEHVLADVHDD